MGQASAGIEYICDRFLNLDLMIYKSTTIVGIYAINDNELSNEDNFFLNLTKSWKKYPATTR